MIPTTLSGWPPKRGRARRVALGSSLIRAMGERMRHHRDLRPGHEDTGVAWELERSNRILTDLPAPASRSRNIARRSRVTYRIG